MRYEILAVSALILLCRAENVIGEIFFVVGDEHLSVAGIAEATVKYIGSGKVKFVEWPKERKLFDFGDAILSNKKIKKVLNWTPQYDLKTGLLKTKEYYKSC